MIPLAFVPFVLRWWKVIAIAALVAAVALYVMGAERNRGLVKLLEADNARHLQTNAQQDAQLRSQTERLKINNARWLEQVQREQDRFAKAKAEAEHIKAQRDTVAAELAAARREWQETVANDPDLAEFVAYPVPDAVWLRLRHATGQ